LVARRIWHEGEVFESKLLKDIHFNFDKYDIRPGDTVFLKENAEILKKYPKVKIQIEGYCDERGTNEYNLALGERRANSTKNYLVSLGISPDRISTISYGEEKLWILDIMKRLGERTEEPTLSSYPDKRMKYPSWVLIKKGRSIFYLTRGLPYQTYKDPRCHP